jgi:hypothetical protein
VPKPVAKKAKVEEIMPVKLQDKKKKLTQKQKKKAAKKDLAKPAEEKPKAE